MPVTDSPTTYLFSALFQEPPHKNTLGNREARRKSPNVPLLVLFSVLNCGASPCPSKKACSFLVVYATSEARDPSLGFDWNQ